MKDYILSLTIWLLLPALLMLCNVILGWGILYFILEIVWFGFGVSVFSIDS